MNKLSIGIIALVVGVIIGGGIMSMNSGKLGGVTIEDETFKDYIIVEDDVTVGEDLILTDNDFCIQFYATSTDTTVKMVASTTVASGSNIGVMTMQYGTCVE